MISVLIPTRNRPDLLAKSIASLINTKGPGEIEFILRLDDDDVSDHKHLPIATYFIIVGPRIGWVNNHVMLDECAQKAKGDWLMAWNDDVLMETPEWNTKLETGHDAATPCVLNFCPGGNDFPVVSKTFYKVLGHWARHTHADTYIQYVSCGTNTEIKVPLIHDHQRERINDKSREESKEVYLTSSPDFYKPHTQELIKEDIEKIKSWFS
jgi:GT2 family glycosyltransferase